MSLKSRIQHGFGKAASQYDIHALLQREVAQQLFRESRSLFPASGNILDAGCGTGYFHELARSHGEKWAITQLDLAFGMCHYAASYSSPPAYGGTFTVNADMELLPFLGHSFDGIFSSLALQWVSNLKQAFAECYRVLKPGASLAFATLVPGTLKELAFAFSCIDDRPHIHHFPREEEVLALLQAAGFKVVLCQTERKIFFHPTSGDLLKSLKGIGASYKGEAARFDRKKFIRLEAYYRDYFMQEEGLPASWEILYITAVRF